MPKHRTLFRWTLDRFFHLLTQVLTIIGFSMLVLAEQISSLVFWLFILPFGASFSARLSQRFQLTFFQANLLTWLYIPLFLADMLFLSGSFVPATLHLILFVQLVKIYQPKRDRDYFYLILLSFLEVLAASSLTINSSFFACLVLYVTVCLAALICFELRRASKEAVSQAQRLSMETDKAQVELETAIKMSPAQEKRAIRTVLAVSLVSLCAISLLGTALFFAMPRFGAGFFSRSVSRTLNLSGFSDRIQLGSIGTIQLDPSIVMRVKVNGDPKLFDGLKWRGVTLDHFDGRTWSKRVRGSSRSFPSGQVFPIREGVTTGTLVKYQVMMEPCSTSYLFTLDRLLTLRGNLYPFIYDPVDDSITARLHAYYRLTYQADSLLSPTVNPIDADNKLPFEAAPAYLQLPRLDKRVSELARSVTFQAQSPQEKARRVEQYLQTSYSYSLEPAQLETPQPITSFLFATKRGHCEYFASAMVIMLRTLEIPSRIVNGFRANEYNEIGGDFIIRGKDAHSWVEVHFPENGWQTYDPTPASSQTTPRHSLFTTISNYLDAFELFWGEWVLGYDEVTQILLFRDLQEKSARWTQQSQHQFYKSARRVHKIFVWVYWQATEFARREGWRLPFFCIVAGLGGWLGSRLYRDLQRRRLLRRAALKGDGTLAIQFYGEMLRFLRTQGKAKPQNLTPNEFVETFENHWTRRKLEQLTSIYNAMRFSRSPLKENEIQQAYRILAEIKQRSRKREVIY